MKRRKFIIAGGAAAVTTMAGCLSGDSEPEDPRERAGWYVQQGAESSGGFVDEILRIGAGESDDHDGFDVTLEYLLSDGGVSDAGDAEFRANATALAVFESAFEDSTVRINTVRILAKIETIDQQGQEGESDLQRVDMLREDAEAINWDNLQPDQIPVNAAEYSFNRSYY